ncbi:hypothetical protein [Phenylobacterium ferrooxidans]|uniref:Uncharacterized protein n=1 Tax=Phenylobacterium ferrooxidans TaxID=2982689 RepID=A0ABW6CJR4_9CAUL
MAKSRTEINADYVARRKMTGSTKVTVWLEPEPIKALERLRTKFGSKDAAISAAVVALDETTSRAPDPS